MHLAYSSLYCPLSVSIITIRDRRANYSNNIRRSIEPTLTENTAASRTALGSPRDLQSAFALRFQHDRTIALDPATLALCSCKLQPQDAPRSRDHIICYSIHESYSKCCRDLHNPLPIPTNLWLLRDLHRCLQHAAYPMHTVRFRERQVLLDELRRSAGECVCKSNHGV